MKRLEVLEGAAKCVCQDRETQYGSPEDNFQEIAKMWMMWLDVCITPHDVAIMMTLMKLARLKTGAFKDDSYIDACGYLACASEVGDSQKEHSV